jgi:hypothetical protein
LKQQVANCFQKVELPDGSPTDARGKTSTGFHVSLSGFAFAINWLIKLKRAPFLSIQK